MLFCELGLGANQRIWRAVCQRKFFFAPYANSRQTFRETRAAEIAKRVGVDRDRRADSDPWSFVLARQEAHSAGKPLDELGALSLSKRLSSLGMLRSYNQARCLRYVSLAKAVRYSRVGALKQKALDSDRQQPRLAFLRAWFDSRQSA